MKRWIGALVMLCGIGLFSLSFFYEQILLFIIGIPVLIGGIFLIVFTMVYDLYQKDKKIDYEMVKKYGFHLMECPECGKENVLEDIYCTHCGEKLLPQENKITN